jgi:hypothetical protein
MSLEQSWRMWGPYANVPGVPYVNVWSEVGTALENNQAVALLVGKIAQQVTTTAGRLEKLVAKANRVTLEEGQLRAQVFSLHQIQRAEETKTNNIVGQMHTLVLLLNQVQQDVQQHNLKVPNNAVMPEPSPNLMMSQGVPLKMQYFNCKLNCKWCSLACAQTRRVLEDIPLSIMRIP